MSALRFYPKLRDDSNLRGWLLRSPIARRSTPTVPGRERHCRSKRCRSPPPSRRWAASANRRFGGRCGGFRTSSERPCSCDSPPIWTTPRSGRHSTAASRPRVRTCARGWPRSGRGGHVHERVNRMLERAEAEGLVDVAYAETDTPVGRLLVAATPRGLVRVSFRGEPAEQVLAELSERISPRVLLVPAKLDEVRRELDQYFEGRRRRFELPLDWALTSSEFRRRVLERTAEFPTARRSATAMPLPLRATSGRCERREPRSAPTRSRSWCPATACFAPVVSWVATAAGWRRSGICWIWRRGG